MAMGKVNTSGSGESIFGNVPELGGQASKALKEAMGDLGDSFSNKINGDLKCDDVEYKPEEGK
jgi:hypothetical protein